MPRACALVTQPKQAPTLCLWNIRSQKLCSLLLIPLLCDVPWNREKKTYLTSFLFWVSFTFQWHSFTWTCQCKRQRQPETKQKWVHYDFKASILQSFCSFPWDHRYTLFKCSNLNQNRYLNGISKPWKRKKGNSEHMKIFCNHKANSAN